MKYATGIFTSIALVLAATTLVGCQTRGEAAGLGALIGAGAGALIGDNSGMAGEGAIFGAAAGAIAGMAIQDEKELRENETYGGTEVEGPRPRPRPRPPVEPRPEPVDLATETLVLSDVAVLPSKVRRGNMVEVSIQYEVMGTNRGLRLTETRSLMQDGEVIETFASRVIVRGSGTWVSPQQFRISERLDPGEYTILQTVESRNARIAATSKLTIR